jgi:hypothetical protein
LTWKTDSMVGVRSREDKMEMHVRIVPWFFHVFV